MRKNNLFSISKNREKNIYIHIKGTIKSIQDVRN